MTTPITELPNPLTAQLDAASPLGTVRLLRQVDAQIFSGWQGEAGLTDAAVLAVMAQVATIAAQVFAHPHGLVVMTGAGTSGRMAFVVARAFNLLLATQPGLTATCRYLTAGDDAALFLSREAPEDNWRTGRARLEELLQEAGPAPPRVLLIGITCGLSAPFVAAQLDYALAHLDTITPVILGFNPPRLARAAPVEGWDQTVAGVVRRLQETPGCFVLTPVVGPEAVTGSTRMKGGSATKIMLEIVLSLAFHATTAPTSAAIPPAAVWALLGEYEQAVQATYVGAAPAMAALVELAGTALARGGQVAYLGQGPFGIAALIDASECPPTFGAAPSDVRGYLDHGFATLRNHQGDLSVADASLQLSWQHFATSVLPAWTARDLVVLVPGDMALNPAAPALVAQCQAQGVPVAVIAFSDQSSALPASGVLQVVLDLPATRPSCFDASLSGGIDGGIEVSTTGPACHFLAELAVKLVLNAATTGGHVMKGKVLGNLMVDLQVSNNKLFYRSVGIVAHFSRASPDAAEWALLRAIHAVDDATPTPAVAGLPVSAHIRQAALATQSLGTRVVPTAIVLAAHPTVSVAAACALLRATPLVHRVLATLDSGSSLF